MKFKKKEEEGQYLLDVLGYVCPHPQVYTKKALEKLKPGDVLEVVFDNPSSGETIANMCGNTGHEIIDRKQEGGQFIFNIRRT